MMMDLGLATGIKDLWQENLLRDYTLIVEGNEFQVHKVVLAAVSKYFKAMLGETYMESKMDKVEVKGFSADIVSKLLEFIYTADENIIAGDTLGILQCAVYLQMPTVAEFCVKKLMENLNIQNCLRNLSAMTEYSFHKEVKELKDFIQKNWGKVMENFNPEVTSYEALQVLIEFWERSEWEKFLCIKNWICQDYENHISFVNDLMCRVRFCIISPQKLKSIMQMDIYFETEGSWKDLVLNGVEYHQLPIHLKVLDISEESEVKTEPVPAFFSVKSYEDTTVNLFALGEEKNWVKQEHKNFKASVSDEFPETVCLEVNNFLIVCRSSDENQDWEIFDPRTLTWYIMPKMDRPKRYFAMVHHKDILYTVGGKYIPDIPSCEMEQYSFLTNTWSCVHKLPVSLHYPAACVLGDTMYVSGGWIDDEHDNNGSDGLYCRDLSSDTAEWGKKASCLWKVGRHKMSVLKRSEEEELFIIDLDLKMQFYSSSNDQWSEITNTFKPEVYNHTWLDGGLVFVKGNSVFILNMYLRIYEDDDDELGSSSHVSWKLAIPEEGITITKVDMKEFPQMPNPLYLFGGTLAIPPQNS